MSYDPEAFDAFEAAGWAEKDAGAYDMLLGRVTKRVAEPLLDAVKAGPGTRLLDLATGPGYVAGRAVARGAKAVGLDRSKAMLDFAREHVPDAEFVRGDVTAIPFDDDSFDAVTAAFVLLHLGEPEQAGAEAARVLEPGGAAAFTVWDVPSRGRWLGVLVDAIEDVGVSAPADVPAGPPFFRFADEDGAHHAHHRRGFGRPGGGHGRVSPARRQRGRALGRTDRRGRSHARDRAELRATTCRVRSEPGSTSCSTTMSPATASRCRFRSSSGRDGSRDRPGAPGRRRAGGRLDPELHRLRGGDGGMVRRASARSSGSPCSGSRWRRDARTCSRPAPAPAAARR